MAARFVIESQKEVLTERCTSFTASYNFSELYGPPNRSVGTIPWLQHAFLRCLTAKTDTTRHAESSNQSRRQLIRQWQPCAVSIV